MFAIVYKIWWMIAVLPFLIFIEGSDKFGDFLKRKNIYLYWDIYHAFIVALLVVLLILWLQGFRF
jgi:hypothetical protein